MPYPDPTLRNGVIVFSCFTLLLLTAGTIFPYQINLTEYNHVNPTLLARNPQDYEGEKISLGVQIEEVLYTGQENGTFATTEDGLVIKIPPSVDTLSVGSHLEIRGISYLSSRGYVEATQVYVRDYPFPGVSRSLLHSIPGILAFIALFFAVFRFDVDQFRFVSRRD
ncbi:MAG: hypothetical protein R6V83_04250 [Candidatus Thorarchaeota archaeon]